MSRLRIKVGEAGVAYLDTDHVSFFQSIDEKQTRVWFSNGKAIDLLEPIEQVAKMFGWGPGGDWSSTPVSF
jgi:hypothetical protein